jgi:hypothetical protein
MWRNTYVKFMLATAAWTAGSATSIIGTDSELTIRTRKPMETIDRLGQSQLLPDVY